MRSSSVARRAPTRAGSTRASPTATSASRRSSTSATGCTGAGRRCWHTARRSTLRASGCAFPMRSFARSSRGTSTRWRAHGWGSSPRARPKTISSRECARRRRTNERADASRGKGNHGGEVPHAGVARQGPRALGGPDGDIEYYWVLENGKLLESSLGTIADADFTMTSTYEDSVAIAKGDLDANAAFMQGKMKVTGNIGKLMQLLPLTMSPEYQALQAKLRGVTEY